MKRAGILGLLAVAAAGAIALYATRGGGERIAVLPARGIGARAPAGVRIRVEVRNASTVRGLARRATMHLRDRGFDVVVSGTSPERRDSTLVLDRTHHPDWAARAARAMGDARVVDRPDTLRDVDLTVLVGARWRPPPEPLHP